MSWAEFLPFKLRNARLDAGRARLNFSARLYEVKVGGR